MLTNAFYCTVYHFLRQFRRSSTVRWPHSVLNAMNSGFAIERWTTIKDCSNNVKRLGSQIVKVMHHRCHNICTTLTESHQNDLPVWFIFGELPEGFGQFFSVGSRKRLGSHEKSHQRCCQANCSEIKALKNFAIFKQMSQLSIAPAKQCSDRAIISRWIPDKDSPSHTIDSRMYFQQVSFTQCKKWELVLLFIPNYTTNKSCATYVMCILRNVFLRLASWYYEKDLATFFAHFCHIYVSLFSLGGEVQNLHQLERLIKITYEA